METQKRDFSIWDGDGLPNDDDEAINLLTKDLGMVMPEIEALISANKMEAYVNEKVARGQEGETKEWYLVITRYFWRRVERLRAIMKKLEENVDEEMRLTDEIIAKIEDRNNKRNKIAYEYGWLLQSRHSNDLNWEKINNAIVERWSISALGYIKDKAWKIVQANASR